MWSFTVNFMFSRSRTIASKTLFPSGGWADWCKMLGASYLFTLIPILLSTQGVRILGRNCWLTYDYCWKAFIWAEQLEIEVRFSLATVPFFFFLFFFCLGKIKWQWFCSALHCWTSLRLLMFGLVSGSILEVTSVASCLFLLLLSRLFSRAVITGVPQSS